MAVVKSRSNVELSDLDQFLGWVKNYDDGAFFRTVVGMHAPLWDGINKCDFNLDGGFGNLYETQNRLSCLWEKVINKKKELGMSDRVFRLVYYKKYVNALKLRSEIFELKKLRDTNKPIVCHRYYKLDCTQCEFNININEAKKLEKKKTSDLVDIYSDFELFTQREHYISNYRSHKILDSETWLRLKGYTLFLEDFGVWVRSNVGLYGKKKRNNQAFSYIGMRTFPLGKKDKKVKNINVKTSDDKKISMSKIIDEVAFWRAHTRKQRATMLASMSQAESTALLLNYDNFKDAVMSRVPKWRQQLVTVSSPLPVNKVESEIGRLKRKLNRHKPLLRVVGSCTECGRTSNMLESEIGCWYKYCKKHVGSAFRNTSIGLAKGQQISVLEADKITDELFRTVADAEDIGDFKLQTIAGRTSYVKDDEQGFVGLYHACGGFGNYHTEDICGDLVSNIDFSSVTSKVRIGNGEFTTVEDKTVIDWIVIGKMLHFGKYKVIYSDNNLVSGTPVYNRYNQLCAVIGGSVDNYYTLLVKTSITKEFLGDKLPLDVINKCCPDRLYTNIKHSTNIVNNTTATTKSLAEARVMTAVATGEVESLARHVAAVRDLQQVADAKIGDAMKRSVNISAPVRRRRKVKKANPVVISTTIIMVLMGMLNLVEAVSVEEDIAKLRAILKMDFEHNPETMNLFLFWYANVDNRIRTDQYQNQNSNAFHSLKKFWEAIDTRKKGVVMTDIWYFSDNKNLDAAKIYHDITHRLDDVDGMKTMRINVKNLSSALAKAYKSISINQKELFAIKDVVNNYPDNTLVINDIHHILKRELDATEEDKLWYKAYGKSKLQVLDCLKPVTGDYTNIELSKVQSTLLSNFSIGINNFDYEHHSCREKLNYYKKLIQCTREDILGELPSTISHKCHVYHLCRVSIKHTLNLLMQTYDASVQHAKLTVDNCEVEKQKLEDQFKIIKLQGHTGSVKIKPTAADQCVELPNWQTEGWVGGKQGSCVTGLLDHSWKTKGCVDLPIDGCLSRPDSSCHLGWGNIVRIGQKIFTNSHKNNTKLRCCSLHCFEIEHVYEIFTHQPLCSDCIKAFTPVFWNEQCLLTIKKQQILAISITKTKTFFELDGVDRIICGNSWHFNICCGNKGPAPYITSDTFKDKHCVCSQAAPSWWDIFSKRFITYKDYALRPGHVFILFTLLVIFITYRQLGVVLIIAYLAWMVLVVDGACSVENLVPVDATTSVTGVSKEFVQVKVKPGQCISVGDATIEVVSVEVVTIYNFLRVIPYHIKPICQLLDWGCPAGESDKIYQGESDCYANCIPGLRKQWKDSEYDWIGDKCFLNGRVATRYDICFSYGAPNTFVELYTRVSGTPLLNLQVKFHGIGFESVGVIQTSNVGADNPVNIIDVVSQPIFWPEMISHRLGKYLCAYHYVESSETCNSGDVFKPMDMDVDCLSLTKKWNTMHGGYELQYEKRDFETQLHNNFVDCGLNFEIENNVTTLQYKQSIDWVEFKIIGNSFHFAESVPYCKDLTQWKITAEPGLTYYHRRTQVKFSNGGTKCKIFISIDGCVSTNGNLIVLDSKDNLHIIEYWCGANSTGTAHITVANGVVEVKELKVLNNFLPHKNSIKNGFEKVIRAATMKDVWSWFSELFNKIDFQGFLSYFSWIIDFFRNFSWFQLLIGVVLGLLAWQNFMRGKIMNVIICLFLIWLLCFTKVVFAKTTYDHGHYKVANQCQHFILSIFESVLKFRLEIATVLVFLFKITVSRWLWFCNVIGNYHVLDIELILNNIIKHSIMFLAWQYGVYSFVTVMLAFHLVEFLDRVRTLSSCENSNIAYNNLLTGFMTYGIVSDDYVQVNQLQDHFLTIDTIVETSVFTYLNGIFRCGDYICDLVLPTQVLNYEWCVVKTPIGFVTHFNSLGRTGVFIINHCLEAYNSGEDCIVVSTVMHPQLGKFTPNIPPKNEKGYSGLPILKDDQINWLVGFDKDGNTCTTTTIKVGNIDWKYGESNNHIMYSGGKVKLYKSDVIDGTIYYTRNTINWQIGTETSVLMLPKNVCLIYNFPSLKHDHIKLNGTYVNNQMIASAINLEPDMVEFEVYSVPDIILTEQYVNDPVGTRYVKTPKGLIADLCWPKHVSQHLGVEVCNDICMRDRVALLSVRKQFNVTGYVWNIEKNTMDRVILNKTTWWPSSALSSQVEPIRLQHSMIFRSDLNLTSGSLIYVKTRCLFGEYVPISCVTKSFLDRSKKCWYVVSTPADEYMVRPMCDNTTTIDVDWNGAGVNEPITIQSYCVKTYVNTTVVEFVNSNSHTVLRLKQTFEEFPVDLKNHSPDFKAVYKTALDFLEPEFAANVANMTDKSFLDVLVLNYDLLLKYRLLNKVTFPVTIVKLLRDYNNSVDLAESFTLLENVPMLPSEPNIRMDITHRLRSKINFSVCSLGEAKPWSGANIHLTTTADVDQVNVQKSLNIITIVCLPGDVADQLTSVIRSMLESKERYITITITGHHLHDIGQLDDILDCPLYLALCSVIYIRTPAVKAITNLFSVKPLDDIETFIENLLPCEWRMNKFSGSNIEMGDFHDQSVKNWVNLSASVGWESRRVSTSFGSMVNTIEELSLGRQHELVVGLVRNCIKRGSYFIINGTLITNWHVTKGCSVYVTANGMTYKFENPVYYNTKLDICMYGKKIEFEPTQVGEVVTAFNPHGNFGVQYMVTDNYASLQGRDGSQFLKLVPIKISKDGVSNIVSIKSFRGMSGSPIVNIYGKVVGIFGLGMVETFTNLSVTTSTMVNYSGLGTMKVDSLNFFDMCAKNLVLGKSENNYYYCNAPTGSGKTTKLPPLIVKHHSKIHGNCAILILQPNVTSVVNCAQYMAKIIEVLNITDCKVGYEIGIRNDDCTKTIGGERETKHRILIRTYGKNYECFHTMNDFNYVILDEVHVIKDISLVATTVRLQTHNMFSLVKFLYMSATHLSVLSGYDIAEGETLSATPKAITSLTYLTENKMNSSLKMGETLVIAKDVIKGMQSQSVLIDSRHLTDGLVLFFCATKRDCERGASFGKRLGIQSWAYHGDSSQEVFDSILNSIGNTWVFATDIIQQSVTLPQLKCVVDFMTECKPKVRLEKEPLMYDNTIEFRIIDVVTQTQRKGRLGRVIDGVYISNSQPVDTRTVEHFAVPEVVLKLLDNRIPVETCVSNNLELQSAIRSYSWLHPSVIPKYVPNTIKDMQGKVIIDYNRKLELTKNKEFDRVKWYVRPYYTVEELGSYSDEQKNVMFGSPHTSFTTEYANYCVKVSAELSKKFLEMGHKFTSFKEKFDNMDEEFSDVDIFERAGITQVAAQLQSEQSLPVATFIIGSCASLYAIAEYLFDNKASRQITHVSVLGADRIANSAKYLVNDCKNIVVSTDGLTAVSWISTMKNWIKYNSFDIWSRLRWSGKTVTQSETVDLLLSWLTWLENQISCYLGFNVDVQSIFGGVLCGTALGALFRSLEESVGRPMAILIGVSVSGLVGYFSSITTLLTFGISAFVSQLIRSISSSVGAFGSNHAGTCWAHLISLMSGGAIGYVIKQNSTICAQVATSAMVTNLTTASVSNVGRVGVPVLLVKHIYTCIKTGKFDDCVISGVSLVSLMGEIDFVTIAYAAVFGATVCALEIAALWYFDKYVNREYASPENGQYLRDKRKLLENMVQIVLSTSAVVVYPQSLISILISTFTGVLKGVNYREAVGEGWIKYAGVSPLVALVSEVLGLISSQVTAQSALDLRSIFGKVSNFLRQCTGFLINAFKNLWLTIKRGLIRLLDNSMDNIIGSMCKTVASKLRGTIVGRFVPSSSLMAIESSMVFTSDPTVNSYLLSKIKTTGLTSIERYWMNVNPGTVSAFGTDENVLLADIRREKVTISNAFKFTSKAPLGFFKVLGSSIAEFVNRVVGSVEYADGVLTSKLKAKGFSANVRFSNFFEADKIQAIITVDMVAYMAWVIEVTHNNAASWLTVYEFNTQESISAKVLELISGVADIDPSTKQQLSVEAKQFWYNANIGACTSNMFSKMYNEGKSKLVNAVFKNLGEFKQKIEEYVVPPYVYSPSYLFKNFSGTKQELRHLRYWVAPMCSYLFHKKVFTNHDFADTKWHYPNGYKPVWLSDESVNIPDFDEDLVYGLRTKTTHQFSTPFLVTKHSMLSTYLLTLFALNNEINVRYTIANLTGGYTTYYSVDGNQQCGKCYLHVFVSTTKYKYKLYNDCCCMSLIELSKEDYLEELSQVFASVEKDSMENLNHLLPLFNGEPCGSTGGAPKVNFEHSPLRNRIIYNASYEELVEQSENFISKILNFFGLLEDPDKYLGKVDLISRMSFLMTQEQLEDEDYYEFDEPINVSSPGIIGFEFPIKGRISNWQPFTCLMSRAILPPYEVMSVFRQISKYAGKNDDVKNLGRVALPSSKHDHPMGMTIAQSQGFYKMQQLFEAYPGFFDSSEVILNPACGAGGFEHFLATTYFNYAPKLCMINTMIREQHSIPNVDKLSFGNFKVFSLIHPSIGDGDLRNSDNVDAIIRNVKKIAKPDLVIFDIGEIKTDCSAQYRWWTHGKCNIISSMIRLIETLQPGGKLLLRWTGYFTGGEVLLHKLIKKFGEFRVLKLGSTSFFSPEFYIYCSKFSKKEKTLEYVRSFYNEIGYALYDNFSKSRTIWFNPGSYKKIERTDWKVPINGTYTYQVSRDLMNRPGALTLEFRYGGISRTITWNPNWENRIKLFKLMLNNLHSPTGRKHLRFVHCDSGAFKNLYEVGYVLKKQKTAREKHTFNGLLSDVVWNGFKMDKNTSPIAMTQTLPEQSKASFKKRLDIKAPTLNPEVASELREAMQLIVTEYGKSLFGKLGFANESTVLKLLNRQGATSVLSSVSNLQAFIDEHENWYDLCMKLCVEKWGRGENSHCFFNVMHKNEPKKKKNFDGGKIVLEKLIKRNYELDELREELERNCLLPHRFIQYADEISRISHYIVLGNLILSASEQKLYKGTINGTPPFLTGNLLRSVWDMNSSKQDRFFDHTSHKHNINYDFDVKLGDGSKPCGIILDFSSFDGSVSIAERMAECDWVCNFYHEKFHRTINMMFVEMTYVICVDHSGRIWLRDGQRGSGEIMTSLGNTLICIVNILRVIKKATGSRMTEITKTVTVVTYKVKNIVKRLEIMPYMIFADGDDVVVITTINIARMFVQVADSTLKVAGKTIRSGNDPGCKIVTEFYDIEFCSHKYEATLIGPGANFYHSVKEIKKQGNMEGFHIRFLPTRPTSEILGKLRSTLKLETQNWNYGKMSERAIDITRNKIMSYLLLYPHMRYVRYVCLTALNFVGDGKISLYNFKKRYDYMITASTISGAFDSVYGVKTLDDFSLRNYKADGMDARNLEYNVSMSHFYVKNDVTAVTNRLFSFMVSKNCFGNMYKLDSKVYNRYEQYLKVNIE